MKQSVMRLQCLSSITATVLLASALRNKRTGKEKGNNLGNIAELPSCGKNTATQSHYCFRIGNHRYNHFTARSLGVGWGGEGWGGGVGRRLTVLWFNSVGGGGLTV